MNEEPKARERTSPKDVFLHLLAILALYASAASFIFLIFQYINLAIPDPVVDVFYEARAAREAIRWSVASLVVIFPAYVLTTWYLSMRYEQFPEKQNLSIRKWLIYFTLFAAAIIISGSLVRLIFRFLGGELTLRFVLKVLTVFFVAGSVFTYYFWDLKRHNID